MKSRFGIRRSLALASTLAAACIALAPGPAAAQQATLQGSWSGSGTVRYSSGATESARCNARFSQRSGDNFSMNAVCASASGRVVQTGELSRVSATRFVGEFNNPQYGITGSITISVRGSSLTASLSGGGGSAQFNLSR